MASDYGDKSTDTVKEIAESIGHLFDHLPGDEAARIEPQDDAELQELIDPHFPLPVEDIPEALSVDSGASCELGNRYTLQFASCFKLGRNGFSILRTHRRSSPKHGVLAEIHRLSSSMSS